MSRNFDLLRQLEDLPETDQEPSIRKSIEDLREIPRAKVDEPHLKEIPRAETKQSVNDEISRLVQSLFLAKGRELRNIVFCGVEDDSGGSFLCVDVGRALAARSELVCLVDVNLRSYNLSRYFGVMESPCTRHANASASRTSGHPT